MDFQFLEHLDTEIVQVAETLTHRRQVSACLTELIAWRQWDERSQAISMHGIDLVSTEFFFSMLE